MCQHLCVLLGNFSYVIWNLFFPSVRKHLILLVEIQVEVPFLKIFWEFPWWCTKPTKRVTVVQERKKEKQWINCGHFVAIQLTQISQECPHEERGRGPPLTIFPQQIVNFLGKHEVSETFFGRDIMFKMFSEAAELCWKTDHLTKSLSCFIVRSHVGVKCVIYCASFWRVHNLGDRPRCVKNERRKRETGNKKGEAGS